METRLSEKEKELVAVGASVAAGCIPCTRYHVKAVQVAGATIDEITHAVDVALGVKRGTTEIMGRVAHEALGLPVDASPVGVPGGVDRMSHLVSIAAAVASSCPTSFQQHAAAGRSAGIRDDEIRLVVRVAQLIRAKATEKMDEAAKGIAAATAPSQPACGCGS